MNKNENIDIIKKDIERINENRNRKKVMLKMFMEIYFMILVTFFAYFINNIFMDKITDKDVMCRLICWLIVFAVVCWIVFLPDINNLIRKFSIFILSIFNGVVLNDIIGYVLETPFEKMIVKEILVLVIITLIFVSCKFKRFLKWVIIIGTFILANSFLFESIISIENLFIVLIIAFVVDQKAIIKNKDVEIYVIKGEAIKFELLIYAYAISMLFCSII